MDAKPLIDRLLHATAASRQRDAARRATAGSTDVDEQPLADLAFARELKKLRYVEDGRFIVAALRTRFEDWATKYEAAGNLHGIACLHDRAKVLRMIADSFQDAGTTIRTFVEIEQERTRGATAAKQNKNAIDTKARHAAIMAVCAQKGWRLDESGIADALATEIKNESRFKGKDGKPLFSVSRRTIARDLQTLLATTT
jgi:hypothetical protein